MVTTHSDNNNNKAFQTLLNKRHKGACCDTNTMAYTQMSIRTKTIMIIDFVTIITHADLCYRVKMLRFSTNKFHKFVDFSKYS